MTDNQKSFVKKVKTALASYKEANDEAEFITLTELKKHSKLGKGRLKDTLRLAKVAVTVEMVPNMNKEGREDGEVRQYQIAL